MKKQRKRFNLTVCCGAAVGLGLVALLLFLLPDTRSPAPPTAPVPRHEAGGPEPTAVPVASPAKTSHDPKTTEQALVEALAADDRNAASQALRRIAANAEAHAEMIRRLALDDTVDTPARILMVALMRGFGDRDSLEALLRLSDGDQIPGVRAEALKSLGDRHEAESEQRLREVATDARDPGRAMALSLLGGTGQRESRELLLAVVNGEQGSPDDLNAALYALGRYQDDETVELLLAVADDPKATPRLRATALYALGRSGAPQSLPAIKANLLSGDREVQYSAVLATVRVSDGETSAKLVDLLCDAGNHGHVRRAASTSLARHATSADLSALRESVRGTDGYGLFLASQVFLAKNDVAAAPVLRSLAASTPELRLAQRLKAAADTLEQKREE